MTTPPFLVGYTDSQCCNDPRGAFYNGPTRAMIVRADGTGRREVGASLITRDGQRTQFAGWWPDGRHMNILSSWESEENGIWEIEHKEFRILDGHWLVDSSLVDLETDAAVNLTAVERISCYNVGMAPLPGGARLAFSAIVGGQMRPFTMDPDGRNKRPVEASGGFIYGIAVSPDGKRSTYHADYKLFLADGDGSNAVRIETGHAFNFLPMWSSDSKWVLFQAGAWGGSPSPHLIAADGTGLRKLADRGGYKGCVEMLDFPDFHSESSDLPVWSPDAKWVYFTAKVGEAVELMRVSVPSMEGSAPSEPRPTQRSALQDHPCEPAVRIEQITHSAPGVMNYHPAVSPDSGWVVFGSTRDGARALYVARADGSELRAITTPTQGKLQGWPNWQPM